MLLDLVAGHTSDQHQWFRRRPNDPDDHRYIWADRDRRRGASTARRAGERAPSCPRPGPRPGYYLRELLRQPARAELRLRPARPGRAVAPARGRPGAAGQPGGAARIMAFWLDRGVAGFRVDMAFSLVKDDAGSCDGGAVARDAAVAGRQPTRRPCSFPRATSRSRSTWPARASRRLLPRHPPRRHRSLFNNGGAGKLPWLPVEPCYFDAAAEGSPRTFLELWDARRAVVGPDRPDPAGHAPTTTSPGWPAGTGRPSSCRWRSPSC